MTVSEVEWRRRTDQFWRGIDHAARIGAGRVQIGPNIVEVVTERLNLSDGASVQTVNNRSIRVDFASTLPPDTVQAVMG